MDELAKSGSQLDQNNVPVSQKIRLAKVKNAKWNLPNPIHPRASAIYREYRTPKMNIEKKWPRKVRSLYARLRTGHAKELADYQHRMLEKIDSPNCVECNTTEDTEHVLCHCVITEEARVRNWSGNVTLDMLRDEPEVSRRILTPRFTDLKVKKEDN